MDGRNSLNHNQKTRPSTGSAIDHSTNGGSNGHGGVAPFSTLPLGKSSNAEGLVNGTKIAGGSISKATNPRSRTQRGKGKNKAKGTDSANSLPRQNREQDKNLPVANVVRIMRRGLPAHAKVADEAKDMLQESVTEFISFITSEANETCKKEQRKTIMAEDLTGAMSKLGFDHFVEPLMMYLQKYRENELGPVIPNTNVPHGSNTAPGYDSAHSPGAAGVMQPTNDGLSPFAAPAVIHPQYGMFASGGNGMFDLSSIWHGELAPGSGTGNISQYSAAATFQEGNVPSSAMGIQGEPSAADGGAGPSRTPQANTGSYDPYGQYE